MQLSYSQAMEIIKNSEILYSEKQLDESVTSIARQIEAKIVEDIPVFLSVMNGGLFFAANLLKQITKPFIMDYIHASRYGDAIYGKANMTWHRTPKLENLRGRHVYIIDDILDEGHTLAEIKKFLLESGAAKCEIIVLIDKKIDKEKPVAADYVGLSAPNHFLFGYGMDIYGLYRQLPDIYMYKT